MVPIAVKCRHPVVPGRSPLGERTRNPDTSAMSLDSGFGAIGPRFARTHWRRAGMTGRCGIAMTGVTMRRFRLASGLQILCGVRGSHTMYWIANLLVALVAALHIYFLVLEMFLWTKPLGLKTFHNTPEKAQESAVLAANQGLYNGFLAAGLIWGLLQAVPSLAFQIKVFFLLCVIVAGAYGAATVSRRILYVQAAPAALALILLWLA